MPVFPNQFSAMLNSVAQSNTAPANTKIKSPGLPDVSAYRGQFTPDPNEPDNWRYDPVTNKPVALKGQGFLGPLKVPGTGTIASEYSVGVEIDGKETDIPSLVPTLTTDEVKQVLDAAAKDQPPPQSVIDKATAHAIERIKAGKSPFAGPEDYPPELQQ